MKTPNMTISGCVSVIFLLRNILMRLSTLAMTSMPQSISRIPCHRCPCMMMEIPSGTLTMMEPTTGINPAMAVRKAQKAICWIPKSQ